jgi:ABC-type Na+ efflux pump permease subunit
MFSGTTGSQAKVDKANADAAKAKSASTGLAKKDKSMMGVDKANAVAEKKASGEMREREQRVRMAREREKSAVEKKAATEKEAAIDAKRIGGKKKKKSIVKEPTKQLSLVQSGVLVVLACLITSYMLGMFSADEPAVVRSPFSGRVYD